MTPVYFNSQFVHTPGGQWPSDIGILGFSDCDGESNQTRTWICIIIYKSVSCDKPKPSSLCIYIYIYTYTIWCT